MIRLVPGGVPAISRGVVVRRNGAATDCGIGPTVTFRGSAPRAFGANTWVEVAWVGAGRDAARESGDPGKVTVGSADFSPRALSWSDRGEVAMFNGHVFEAFCSGRGGTDGEAAYDSLAGDEVTFAAGGPMRCAAEGTGSEPFLEPTG